MTMKVISAGGTATVSIPASSKLAVYSLMPVKVYVGTAYSNMPTQWTLSFTTVEGVRKVQAAYSSTVATQVKIVAGNADACYEVGTTPEIDGPPAANQVVQPTPTAMTTAATMTIAGLLTKIITGTHSAGATAAYTLPTGTLCDAGVSMSVDDAFDWSLLNLSAAAADTITLTAGTDHTIVGNPIVQSAHVSTGGIYGNSARFRTRKTAANTFVTYRIA